MKLNFEQLRCRNCNKVIIDIAQSYEDDFCSEECHDTYQMLLAESDVIKDEIYD